jgi:riboflavin synthase
LFTGIIEEVGKVRAANHHRLTIAAARVLKDTALGDSIAINGACLTVSGMDAGSFSVDVMPETLQRTNLGRLNTGHAVNLERALLVGGRLGGHLVQGHVDATGSIVSLVDKESAKIATIAAPSGILKYVVEKGFIAVDGASLTVIACTGSSFSVSLVGYTLEHTTLGSKRAGDLVNLEADIIAKYVEKFRQGSGITLEFLAEQGFSTGGSRLAQER